MSFCFVLLKAPFFIYKIQLGYEKLSASQYVLCDQDLINFGGYFEPFTGSESRI